MGIPTLLLSVLLFQQPEPAPAAPAGRLDVIELKSGETLEGRITTLVDGYVELELVAGAVVGFSTTEVKAVRRGGGATAHAVPAVTSRPREAWFTLHDGTGAAVGWLHSAVTIGQDGGVRVAEEWEFTTERRRTAVTSFAEGDAQLAPRSCYWHERVTEASPMLLVPEVEAQPQRLLEERIVEATITSGGLQVQRCGGAGKETRTLPLAAGTTFPLLAMERVRIGLDATANGARVALYDPAIEEFTERDFEQPRARTVLLDGHATKVTEVAVQSAAGRNAEWLDGSLRTLRREVNGQALVAVPGDADSVHRSGTGSRIDAALVAEAEHRFGLWLPNPAWSGTGEPVAGALTVQCALRQGRINLAMLDQLVAGTSLEAAADAVQRWLRLLHPELKIEDRSPARVRDRAAIRIDASAGALHSDLRASVHVLPWHDAFLTLTFLAPNESWPELAADFASVLRSIELDKDGVAPTLQGPAQKALPKPPVRPPVPLGKKVPPVPAPVPLDDGTSPRKPRRGRH